VGRTPSSAPDPLVRHSEPASSPRAHKLLSAVASITPGV
jgi:hypothetical protein